MATHIARQTSRCSKIARGGKHHDAASTWRRLQWLAPRGMAHIGSLAA